MNEDTTPATQRAADLASLKAAVKEASGHPFVPATAVAALGAAVSLLEGMAADIAALQARCTDCGNRQGAALDEQGG